ncbi:putative apses transcription factor xbp1 [Erysiphe necator]|uniref:Putative apses transcription factor xbp1 n=1 Tax=Uncinula necator TaxID=52586 RepID=A0A0B1P846_UNCNE|nr:putative apses transcription factor xbp1 [Erysiphe necator]
MLSVASLLNPVKSDKKKMSSSPSRPNFCVPKSSPLKFSTTIKKQEPKKFEMTIPKAKINGDVCYPPFEDLDEQTLQSVRRFQINPLGKIKENSRHIPYNSGKNNFLEKTGRESFEVFCYDFRIPGESKDYTVMWDYNIGLVRITPFFKCCNYTKTTPAKMLAQNYGLRDITHSITGGALMAQGYWMPFNCARDLCATFCHHIASALIPIFGPSFPSICIHPEAPEYGRMIISSKTIAEAAIQAKKSCSLMFAAREIVSTYSRGNSHRLSAENDSSLLNKNYNLLDKQNSGSSQLAETAESFNPHFLSASNPLAKKLYARETFDSYLIMDTNVPSHFSPLKRSHSFLTDISNLQIMPSLNAREQTDVKKNRANKRKTISGTCSGEIRNFSIEKAALSAKEENSTSVSSAKTIDSNSEISSRSEEAKAALSLINLRLKYHTVSYEEAEIGTEPHANRRRATLS